MTRDDIIRMVREACVNLSDKQAVGRNLWDWPMEYQEKPAYRQALVRFFDLAYAAGAAAEREACAQVGMLKAVNGIEVSAAIRARVQDPMPLFDDWPGGWSCPPCNQRCNQGRNCPNA